MQREYLLIAAQKNAALDYIIRVKDPDYGLKNNFVV